jgi:outer membrane protein
MSNLQIWLAIVGGVVLVVLVAYNTWAARQNLPKQAEPLLTSEELDALSGSYSLQNSVNASSSGALAYGSTTNLTTGAVVLSWPFYTGNALDNRVRETLSLTQKAQADLDAATRTVAQNTRSAFFGVMSGVSQVKALQAAVESSQVALEANKLGYSVGVRINMNVLDAQSKLFDTKAKLAKARYDVLMGSLRLRQVSGTLQLQDLQGINNLLEP